MNVTTIFGEKFFRPKTICLHMKNILIEEKPCQTDSYQIFVKLMISRRDDFVNSIANIIKQNNYYTRT